MSYSDRNARTSWADAVANGAQPAQYQGYEGDHVDVENKPQAVPASSLAEEALKKAGSSLEDAASWLWKLDVNRLDPSKDYVLDPQSRTRYTSHDAARSPLILELHDTVWQRSTFASFKKLLDNYTAETGVPERVSSDERAEEEHFLKAICETPCIQFAQRWLAENIPGSPRNEEDFKDILRDIWFRLYSRDASRDSSGFEHVFCGEIDDGKVKGLHNFIQVHVEEQRGNFDYKGYLNAYGDPTPEAPALGQQMLIIRFEWLGCLKSVSSMFVGSSPEFEIALYTMLWLCRRSEAEVQLGPYNVKVKVYDMAGKIGSAFPELLDVDVSKLESEVSTPATLVCDQVRNSVPAEESGASYEDSFPALGAE